ncbi:hypothetical protein VTO73DRAFT_7331 [Trametes versicolor]
MHAQPCDFPGNTLHDVVVRSRSRSCREALTPPSQLAAAASAYGEPLFFFTIQNAWHDLFFGANAHFGSGGRVKRNMWTRNIPARTLC